MCKLIGIAHLFSYSYNHLINKRNENNPLISFEQAYKNIRFKSHSSLGFFVTFAAFTLSSAFSPTQFSRVILILALR